MVLFLRRFWKACHCLTPEGRPQNNMKNPATMPRSSTKPVTLPPYERICLVLQGGGALGSYQAGVYQGLHEAGIEPDYLSGISIGAFNTAIIAGNPPHKRIEKLTEFWETICHPRYGLSFNPYLEQSMFDINDTTRQMLNAWHAANAILIGQRGFFEPRFPPPALVAHGSPETVSYYDTSQLKST